MTATSDTQSAPEPLTVISLTRQLRAYGVSDGHTLLVHSSLKSLDYVGGAEAVVRALLSAVGESGTLMVPTQSWRNLDPDRGVHWDAPEAYYPAIREHWPPYDPAVTPSNKIGAVAETLRTWPGARRSLHPARSFAAVGPNAERLVAGHDLEGVHGDAAPVGKLYDLDGYVLLLGVGHSSNTSLHLAETRADYPGKTFIKETSAMLVGGSRERVSYTTLDYHSEDFEALGEAYEAQESIRLCSVGQAEVRYLRQRPLVDFAVRWFGANRLAAAH